MNIGQLEPRIVFDQIHVRIVCKGHPIYHSFHVWLMLAF